MPARPSPALAVLTALLGCAPFSGRAVPRRVRVDEPGGVRVLYDTASRGPEGELVAADDAALRAIAVERGLPLPQPPVDFTTHVVVGATRWTRIDQGEIDGLTIDAGARVVPFEDPLWFPVGVLLRAGSERRTTLFAIPRRALPPPGEDFLLELSSRTVRSTVPPLPVVARR